MNKKYQIVIFGATGFTGELCVKYMSEKYPDVSIAIAGRNKEKLEMVRTRHGLSCQQPAPIISTVPTLFALVLMLVVTMLI